MEIPRRGVVAVALLGVGAYFALDAWIVTDRERLQGLLDAVAGEPSPAKVDAALRFVDTRAQPLEVTVLGDTSLYAAGDMPEVRARAQRAAGTAQGQNFRVFRKTIEVQGRTGRITASLVTRDGMLEVDFVLRKHGDRWLLERARFQ